MPREKESYRDNLERIKAAYPTKEMLKRKEVADFLGINIRTSNKMFTFNKMGCISVAVLAREMS